LETHRITQNLDPNESEEQLNQQLRAGVNLADRYMIQGVIGVGGMGAVYRARDLHFPNVVKLVAVKEMVIMAPDPLVRKTIVRNFEREANLLATLDHRSIPRIYDYFTLNERSYLVEEFINGKDLEAIINDSDDFISEERLVGWAIELCDVLNFLHTHKPEPIIFRDMKPSNVMINMQDHVVLVDFGIAKHFQQGQKGTMIGTEGYSPPEQYRGDATPLADIYALGATLHHVLTRRDPRLEPPFSFGERPIGQFNPNVSPDLEAVIYKALQYNPPDRIQSAQEMKQALIDVAKNTGIIANVAPPVAKNLVQAEGVKPVWTFQCEDEIRGTPTMEDGLIYIGSYDNNMYAIEAKSGKFVWKFPTEAGIVTRPVVTDGSVYFGSEDKNLYVVSARHGRLNWTYQTDGPIRSSPSLAEGHIFIGSDDYNLHAVNTISGRCSWKFNAGSPIRSTPLIAQDHVFFGTESGDFYSLDFGGRVRWRFSARRGITSSPIINQGVIYVGSLDSTLYALDVKTGWVIWRFRLIKPSITTPCIQDNLLFTGAINGMIYCIDTSSAKEVWRFTTENQVTGSPIVYRDSLYCGSVDGNLYCLDYQSGRLRWKFTARGPITGTPMAYSDIVCIGCADHNLYALLA
jgi:outer membrane protein assembly factor BamB/tRNA A-37 threonylcarbamoyl transferase component Bud32